MTAGPELVPMFTLEGGLFDDIATVPTTPLELLDMPREIAPGVIVPATSTPCADPDCLRCAAGRSCRPMKPTEYVDPPRCHVCPWTDEPRACPGRGGFACSQTPPGQLL